MPSSPAAASPRFSLSLNLPPGFRLDDSNPGLALSPDGQRLTIAASGPASNQRLWIRALGGDQPQPLAGTEDATYPFWSPDGTALGFFAARKLKIVDLASGNVRTVADAPNGRGASWSTDGTIAYAPDYQTGLFLVPASGGSAQQLTTPSGGGSHRMPSWLPGAHHLLFFSFKTGLQSEGIFSVDRTTGKTQLVAPEESAAHYVAPNLILFMRGATLMAQPFDAAAVRTTGAAIVIAESVDHNQNRASGHFSAAASGVLVYRQQAGSERRRLTVYQSDGTRIGEIGAPAALAPTVFVSPDGHRVATLEGDLLGENASAWVYDTASGARTRVRSETGALAWSGDGKQLAFSRNGVIDVQPADGSLPPQPLLKDQTTRFSVASWTHDGRSLALLHQATTGVGIVLLPLLGDRKLVPIVTGPAWGLNGTFAPDDRAIAYTSDQTGRFEVFVSPYPQSGGPLQVTSGGGQHPQWINGGRELAYLNEERKLFAVAVDHTSNQLTLGPVRPLFGGNPLPALPGNEGDREGSTPVYLTPDGTKVVLAVPTDLDAVVPLTLVTNWR
jgi:Tol biopolymer transport system component